MLLPLFLAGSCWQPHSTGQSVLILPPCIPLCRQHISYLPYFHPGFGNRTLVFGKKKGGGGELLPSKDTTKTIRKSFLSCTYLLSRALVCHLCLFKLQTKALLISFLCSLYHHKDTSCFLYILTLMLACTVFYCATSKQTHSASPAAKLSWFALKPQSAE